ncbi:MAG: Crp/Fnr family transcriptional regulator [Clostridia bacterium]
MKILRLIKKNRLFENFEDKEINVLFDNLKGRIVKFSRGMIVAAQGTQIEEIGILLSGTLVKFIVKSDGAREAQGTLLGGDMFGDTEVFLKDKLIRASYVAAEDAAVLYLPTEHILNMGDSPYRKKLMENILATLAEKIIAIGKDSEYLIIKSMRHKIAKLIYDKHLETGVLNVELGINRNEMAEYLNVSRPSMSREMMRMRDEGIIDFWKDKITINDLVKLREIAK